MEAYAKDESRTSLIDEAQKKERKISKKKKRPKTKQEQAYANNPSLMYYQT